MNKVGKVKITDKRRVLEIIAVLMTGIGKFVFMDYLSFRLFYIAISIFVWATYVWLRKKSIGGVLAYWGFRTDNFIKVIYLVIPFGILSVVLFLIVGFIQDTLNPTWHLIPILLAYPIWGIIQQFLVIGLVAGNLQDMESIKLKKPVIIVLTAILFAAIHYPYNWLVLGTFILALFYGYVYLKSRNIYVLGILHGWLGGLFFYTVVDRDPFLEVFGIYLN